MSLPNNIIFSHEIANDLGSFFNENQYSKVAVIVDENTKEQCYPKIKAVVPDHILIEIKSGEEEKNLNTCQHIWNDLTNNAFDRKSLILNLGGGVIGDMTGFASSLYQRGIDFIQVPTTLLSQVDASVGGKTGINNRFGKNLIGAFHQPELVLIDTHLYLSAVVDAYEKKFAPYLEN